MKCADIPDELFLAAVAFTTPRSPDLGPWRARQDVQATFEAITKQAVPEKLFLAKARKLGRKRKLSGCTNCDCRGDYHLWEECVLAGCCGLKA